MFAVAGASGFLGRALVKTLVARKQPVLAVSRQPFAAPEQVRVRCLCDYAELVPPSSDAVLIHLAEESDIAAADALGPAHVERARSAFIALAAKGWRHIVYASSGAIYGDQVMQPRREDEHVAPSHPYGLAKLACETIVTSASGVALRLGNLYGAGLPRRTVLADIMGQLSGSGPIRLRDLSTVRDFIHVNDAAHGFALAAELRLAGIYNLGTGIGTSVGELAEMALDISGQGDRPIVEIAPGGHSSHIVLDMTHMAAATGWRPAVSIKEGLEALLAGER